MTYYFDYGATSIKKPIEVAKKMYEVLSSNNYGNSARGGYKEAINSFTQIYQARKKIAKFFGLEDERYLIFTNNSTESLNIAIKGILKENDHIITTQMEHNSVLRPIYQLEKERNISYTIIDSDEYGTVLYDEIEKNIRKKTKAIAITHASNVTGNVVDIKRISEICKKNNIILIVDGSQTAGVIDTDIAELGIDLYAFTGHKSLFGPQGIGGLCIANKNIEIERYTVGGSGIKTFEHEQPEEYPTRLEAGTLNTPAILGLAEGIDYIRKSGIENLRKLQVSFATSFYENLKELDCLEFYGDFREKKLGTVSFNFKDIASSDIVEVLAEEYNIAVRGGFHCAPLVHKHFKTDKKGMIRFSFSSMNSQDEVDYAIKVIREIAQSL